MRLENKVAIVTGGGGEIGRAISMRLASEGAAVVVADIAMEPANAVAGRIQAGARRALAVAVDVTSNDQTASLAATAIERFGQIDILVNCAGGSARGRNAPFHQSQEEVWRSVINLNVIGTMLCTQAVIHHMLARQCGKIVNIASLTGVIGGVNLVDYSTAKGGVIAFTKALAKEVSPHGINVNAVSPGAIATEGFSRALPEELRQARLAASYVKRFGTPEEVAGVVAFLSSSEADFITGQNWIIDGGRSLSV